jgi:SAM-dependent methyltransferase
LVPYPQPPSATSWYAARVSAADAAIGSTAPPISANDRPEISDLVIAYDPETLERLPVRRDEVVAELERHGMGAAVRVVAPWPHRGGVLDARFVDAVLLRAHHELQRLSEEFRQGERMRGLVAPLLSVLRGAGVPGPYRVVDVGCGLGYVVRWLAAHGGLGADVELVGCDYNAPFVRFASALAAEERLGCSFVVANAFRLAEPATIFTSTGVIHHFRGEGLDRFLAEQGASDAAAFVHCDTKPSYLAPLGSFLFHQARMREPLARHDGVLSAVRAHTGEALVRAARAGCPGFAVGVYDGEREMLPVIKVMHSLVGVRRALAGAYVAATAWGAIPSRSLPAVALTVASSSAVLLLGRYLDHLYGRRSGALAAPE